MKNLITRSQLARHAGVTVGAITHQCAKGKPLNPAVVEDKIDAGHPAVKRYLEKRGVSSTVPAPVEHEHTESTGFPEDDGTAAALIAIADLTLNQIEQRFGGHSQFDNYLKSLKLSEEIREKRLKNEDTDGSVISRDFVHTHIFGLLEELSRRMLTDFVRTITRRIYAAAQSGVSLEEAEAIVRDIVAQVLRRSREQAKKRLPG